MSQSAPRELPNVEMPFYWKEKAFKYLWQSQIYLLSRINAPTKQFGHTLTNQQAVRIDSIFL